MALRESSHLSLDERAYRDVRDMIVQGDLKPGQQIVQEALADRLGISRTPLRKAIATLAQENFLEMDKRGVAYVRSFDDDELTSIWEIRAVLEGLVCRLAVDRIKPQHIAYLRSLITSAAEESTDRDWTAYRQADVHFHNYLTACLDDPLLSKMLDSFQILSLTLARGLLRPPKETLPEHLEIINALSKQDADRAERAMVNHIRTSIEHVKTSRNERDGIPSRSLKEACRDKVGALARALNETVLVACIEEDHAVVAEYGEAARALRLAVRPDAVFPLHATAAGKALLAWMDDEDLQRLLDATELAPITPTTITDVDELRGHLQEVRGKGYAVEDEEHEPGIRSLAVPIRDCDRTVAAVAVLAPASRLEASTFEAVAGKVAECAESISNQLLGTDHRATHHAA